MNNLEQRTHEALTNILLMAGKYDSLCNQVVAWQATAEQNQRNTYYYWDLVVKIGEMFGEAAYIQDDGRRSESVLCAKVPELVRQALTALEKIRDGEVFDEDDPRDVAAAVLSPIQTDHEPNTPNLKKRLEAAEALCRLVEEQLAASDAPDRKDDSPDNRAIREAVAKWRESLKASVGP